MKNFLFIERGIPTTFGLRPPASSLRKLYSHSPLLCPKPGIVLIISTCKLHIIFFSTEVDLGYIINKKKMGSRSSLAGMEVPFIDIDSLKWIDISVSSSSYIVAADPASSTSSSHPTFAPLTEDAASCSIVGDPPTYLIWKVHKSTPHALEVVEFSVLKEAPRFGLRIIFPDPLCPFAYICKDEVTCTSGSQYLLYALTVSGVAYFFQLRNICTYVSCSNFPQHEFMEFNMQSYPNCGSITTIAATTGCLFVGRSDGSVGCFQLGLLDPNAPGFMSELRDDAGINRLWGFMSRGRMVGAVQDMVISEVHGSKLVFVLHLDGILRVWDISSHSRIFSHTMSTPTLAGATFVRLWVAEANHNTNTIRLAILFKRTLDFCTEMIHIYSFHFNLGDKINFSLEPTVQTVPLEEGGLIDVKLTSEKMWILKEDGLMVHNLSHTNVDVEEPHSYALQEAFVADQLFQSSEHSSDDLLWITCSIFSSSKDHIIPFISSIFLRKLLHPGVYHNNVLRATLQAYNKHWTDSEFKSLTIDGVKKEILSLIEHEGVTESPISIFYGWKIFCSSFFHCWCKNSTPYGLLIEPSTGAVGLIRKHSISLFRCMEDTEMLKYDSSDESGYFVSSGLYLSDDDVEREILFEVLRCANSVNQQLGKAASAIFYESLLSASISSEDIVPRLLKILGIGYSSSIAALHVSDLGTDVAWEKELADHKNLRKFSVDMLISLHALCNKTTWGRVLNVIESYLKFLVPRKTAQKLDSEILFNIDVPILVQATSQVAKVMFESAFDVLLLLSYLVNTSGQIQLLHEDISRIQLELVPMIQEIVTEWFIIHFLCTTPSESPAVEDFSSQLSLLQIDCKIDKRSWNERLGKSDFTLAYIILLNTRSSSTNQSRLSNPQRVTNSVREFTSCIIFGMTEEESSAFFRCSAELALILLRHGQYDAVENLLIIVDAQSRKEKTYESIQDNDGKWCTLFHLLGCCLLARAHCGLHRNLRERKVWEAARCLFRASSGQGASKALQSLSREAGLPHLGFSDCASTAVWKLHYYQWAMQLFEQYNISEGACQFALAALEQVDEALGLGDASSESATTINGRLWANVFKFTLDQNHFYDAYCAIVSNPDEESKHICLRRFIIVLYERGAIKMLCDGQLPFVALTEKVERELSWKAERSDVSMKPNPYKLLYAFAMYRHNWRMAATYIYLYSARLRSEMNLKDYQHRSLALQEMLNGLSAAINALQLVHPAYAWIDPLLEGSRLYNEHYPSKKAKKAVDEQSAGNVVEPRRLQTFVDVEKLESEFVLTSAEYLLSMANVKWTFTEIQKLPSDLVDLLVQTNLYDMAFTVVLKFWKGSGLKRELEKLFCAISLKCCPNKASSLLSRTHGLYLTSSSSSSKDEVINHGSPDTGPSPQQSSHWETLEFYLEKYKGCHARLPVVVAQTLVSMDPQVELPLWLVHMFKEGQKESRRWGMSGGQESNPASLFRIYVDYGRYTEAANLVLDYIESLATLRPADVIRRKRTSAVWFPYTAIEQLWCQLDEMIQLGHMVDQWEKLKKLLRGALLPHLNMLKIDSDDVLASAQ